MHKRVINVLQRGIIVSIQGYTQMTTEELAENAINAGAVAVRTDKPINTKCMIIGLNKIKTNNYKTTPYITHTLESVKIVSEWADIIAIDYRKINKNLKEISDYCRENNLTIVADIGHIDDYKNIIENDYYYTYIATTMTIYHKHLFPDKKLVKKLTFTEKNVIAEGNYRFRNDVKEVFDYGVNNVCIGGAISDIYKLTRKYTTILY